jgi:tetratricopeptide (TPR) repeat protein
LLGTSTTAAEEMLEDLVGVHLMEPAEPGRYRFAPLVRLHAREQAANEAAAARKDAIRRLVEWYLHAVESANDVLFPDRRAVLRGDVAAPDAAGLPRTTDEALAWYRAEDRCIAAAVRQAADNGLDALGSALALGAWEYFGRSSAAGDWSGVLEVALESARSAKDRPGEARVLNALAQSYISAGDTDGSYARAGSHLRQAIAIWRETGDTRGQAVALNNLGLLARRQGHLEDAVELGKEAVAICSAGGLSQLEKVCLANLGTARSGGNGGTGLTADGCERRHGSLIVS